MLACFNNLVNKFYMIVVSILINLNHRHNYSFDNIIEINQAYFI